ncbi:MAG: hypothetical protein HZC36_14500 [Armatimonadetes bacterium]|nr:hypothetical protein [Armatimonadota bacterium]
MRHTPHDRFEKFPSWGQVAVLVFGLFLLFLILSAVQAYDPESVALPAMAIIVALYLGCGWAYAWQSVRGFRRRRIVEYAVLSALTCGAYIVSAPVCIYTVAQARRSMCRWNARALADGLLVYAADHDERLPVASSWAEAAREGISHSDRWKDGVRPTHCPKLEVAWSYAYNSALAGKRTSEISDPVRTPLVFSARGSEKPTSGGFESFDPEHAGRGTIASADGAAVLVDRNSAEKLSWNPK